MKIWRVAVSSRVTVCFVPPLVALISSLKKSKINNYLWIQKSSFFANIHVFTAEVLPRTLAKAGLRRTSGHGGFGKYLSQFGFCAQIIYIFEILFFVTFSRKSWSQISARGFSTAPKADTNRSHTSAAFPAGATTLFLVFFIEITKLVIEHIFPEFL